jgi:hypothetical protein
MTTPILGLDELEDSQSQPHVPVNAATRALEQYAQLLTLDKDLSSPPAAVDGDAYIVASGASGAWAGWTNSIAYYSGGWLRIEPRVGMTAYVADEDAYYKYLDGSPGSWDLWTLDSTPVAQPYDIGAQLSGAPTASLVMLRYKFPRAVIFPAGLTDSQGTAGTAATAQTDFDVRKNGASVGTMRFAAAGTSATFIAASQQTYSPGDILTVVAPASPDATLAGVSFVLAGTR